jgi:hypothetical protein
MFHPPAYQAPNTAHGHVSGDGHKYTCKNPILQQPAFHVYVGLTSAMRSLTGHVAASLSSIGMSTRSSPEATLTRNQVRFDELYRQRPRAWHSKLSKDPLDFKQPLWCSNVCLLRVRHHPSARRMVL